MASLSKSSAEQKAAEELWTILSRKGCCVGGEWLQTARALFFDTADFRNVQTRTLGSNHRTPVVNMKCSPWRSAWTAAFDSRMIRSLQIKYFGWKESRLCMQIARAKSQQELRVEIFNFMCVGTYEGPLEDVIR